MNTQNAVRNVLALIACVACHSAHADLLVRVDCQHRSLPSQAAVAAGLGIDNLDQAYQARSRLHAVVNRACHRSRQTQVSLVLQPANRARSANLPAVATARR